jgi:hypothetical protein
MIENELAASSFLCGFAQVPENNPLTCYSETYLTYPILGYHFRCSQKNQTKRSISSSFPTYDDTSLRRACGRRRYTFYCRINSLLLNLFSLQISATAGVGVTERNIAIDNKARMSSRDKQKYAKSTGFYFFAERLSVRNLKTTRLNLRLELTPPPTPARIPVSYANSSRIRGSYFEWW